MSKISVMHLRLAAVLQKHLHRRPILTNSVVYATLYAGAEFSQQTINKYIISPNRANYDLAAGARIVTVGGTLYAPTLYKWYQFLDRRLDGVSPRIVAAKVCADQFVMSPFLLAAFFLYLAFLEGRKDLYGEMREKYWTAFTYNQMFWIPIQTINFYIIPSHLRVLYVAAASFLWINVLCFIKRQKLESNSN